MSDKHAIKIARQLYDSLRSNGLDVKNIDVQKDETLVVYFRENRPHHKQYPLSRYYGYKVQHVYLGKALSCTCPKCQLARAYDIIKTIPSGRAQVFMRNLLKAWKPAK